MGPERHVIYIKNIKCVCLLGIKLRFVDLRFAAPSSETHSTDLDRAVRPDWRPSYTKATMTQPCAKTACEN